MKTGFFEESGGNKSNSRLIAFIVICVSLLLTVGVTAIGAMLAIQTKSSSALISSAAASGTLFLTIAGTALLFVFGQKKEETKQRLKDLPGLAEK